MAPYELILKLDGALWLRIIFKTPSTPQKIKKGNNSQKSTIFLQGKTPPRFGDPPAKLEEHLRELQTTDIFFMTGFSAGKTISEMLLNVFKNHAINGNDEANDFGPLEDLFRCIKERVQYNRMVYMGTCGGACCAGKWLWSMQPSGLGPIVRDFELFDFCIGVSLHYNAGMSMGECPLVVDENTFQMTGGAALAVHIEKDIASASSFPCGKNNTWYPWCAQATVAHQSVVTWLAKRRVSGPWWHPTVGTWFFSIRGVAYAKM